MCFSFRRFFPVTTDVASFQKLVQVQKLRKFDDFRLYENFGAYAANLIDYREHRKKYTGKGRNAFRSFANLPLQRGKKKAKMRAKINERMRFKRKVNEAIVSALPNGRDIITELLDENYELPGVNITKAFNPARPYMPNSDFPQGPELDQFPFRMKKTHMDAYVGLEDLARGTRRPVLSPDEEDIFAEPPGFTVDEFQHRYLLLGRYDYKDHAVMDKRLQVFDYHMQWGRRTALLDQIRYRRFFLPQDFLKTIKNDLSSNVLIDEEYTLLTYDRLTPIAQVVFLKANRTKDIFDYLSIEPFLTRGILNPSLKWEVFPITYPMDYESHNFTLNVDILKPYFAMGYWKLNLNRLTEKVGFPSFESLLLPSSSEPSSKRKSNRGKDYVASKELLRKNISSFISLLSSDNQKVTTEFFELANVLKSSKFTRHLLLFDPTIYQEVPNNTLVLRPQEYENSPVNIPRIIDRLLVGMNQFFQQLSSFSRSSADKEQAVKLLIRKILFYKYQLHQLLNHVYTHHNLYHYQYFNYEEKMKQSNKTHNWFSTWNCSRICSYRPLKDQIHYPQEFTIPAPHFEENSPVEEQEIPFIIFPEESNGPTSAHSLPSLSPQTVEETFSIPPSTCSFSISSSSSSFLTNEMNEFQKEFNFSFPLPADPSSTSVHPRSSASPASGSTHSGVHMVINAISNGDALRYLAQDKLIRQFFPDSSKLHDLKAMVTTGPIYQSSDELYDRLLV
jgi:hypothetical protein